MAEGGGMRSLVEKQVYRLAKKNKLLYLKEKRCTSPSSVNAEGEDAVASRVAGEQNRQAK